MLFFSTLYFLDYEVSGFSFYCFEPATPVIYTTWIHNSSFTGRFILYDQLDSKSSEGFQDLWML